MKSHLKIIGSVFQILTFVLIALLCPQDGFATAPEDIRLAYDMDKQTLSVTITHDTMLKGSHYVKYVEIKKNGAVISINTYKSQPSGKTFTYKYKIPAIEEDTFVVTATCNMYGSKKSPMFVVAP